MPVMLPRSRTAFGGSTDSDTAFRSRGMLVVAPGDANLSETGNRP